jgi:hypothetical protein
MILFVLPFRTEVPIRRSQRFITTSVAVLLTKGQVNAVEIPTGHEVLVKRAMQGLVLHHDCHVSISHDCSAARSFEGSCVEYLGFGCGAEAVSPRAVPCIGSYLAFFCETVRPCTALRDQSST